MSTATPTRQVLIDGAWRDANAVDTFTAVNPSDG